MENKEIYTLISVEDGKTLIQLRVSVLADKLVRYANSADVPSVKELENWYVEMIKLAGLAKQIDEATEQIGR